MTINIHSQNISIQGIGQVKITLETTGHLDNDTIAKEIEKAKKVAIAFKLGKERFSENPGTFAKIVIKNGWIDSDSNSTPVYTLTGYDKQGNLIKSHKVHPKAHGKKTSSSKIREEDAIHIYKEKYDEDKVILLPTNTSSSSFSSSSSSSQLTRKKTKARDEDNLELKIRILKEIFISCKKSSKYHK